MKKLLAVLLVITLLLSLAACGGGNKQSIVGTWRLVNTDVETDYGLEIEFTKKGELIYEATEDELAEGMLEGLDMLVNFEYKIISDTEMELTVSAFLGLASESDTVEYRLDGDTLEFDGATYTRLK